MFINIIIIDFRINLFHFIDDVITVLDQPLVCQVISIPVQLVPGLPRGPVEVGLLDKVDSAGLGHMMELAT